MIELILSARIKKIENAAQLNKGTLVTNEVTKK